MAKTVIKIENEKKQNSGNAIRQFTKRAMSSGILRTARGNRFFEREPSELIKKRRALNRIEKGKQIKKLIKLGKPLPKRRGRR